MQASESVSNREQKDREIPWFCQISEKLRNIELTVTPILVGALRMVPKCLEDRLG